MTGPYALLIVFFIAFFDFSIGGLIARSESPTTRKILLWISLASNLSILIYFKYSPFLVSQYQSILGSRENDAAIALYQVALPVGISFYTFESISYVVDVYRKKYEPKESLLDYLLFICYFPHVIDGPIIRPEYFMSQLHTGLRLKSDNLKIGIYRFAVGLAKKVLLADPLAALWINRAFQDYQHLHALDIWFALMGCSFYIYFDFSGYTDMAIGLSRILDINLIENFRTPFASQNFKQFFQRWHICLSLWLREYVYIPMGGSREGWLRTAFNFFTCMVVAGIWHGARSNFLIWGIINGLLGTTSHFFEKTQERLMKRFPPLRPISIILTFLVTSALLSLFRNDKWIDAKQMLQRLVFSGWDSHLSLQTPMIFIVLLAISIALHILSTYGYKIKIENYFLRSGVLANGLLLISIVTIIASLKKNLESFIYFDF